MQLHTVISTCSDVRGFESHLQAKNTVSVFHQLWKGIISLVGPASELLAIEPLAEIIIEGRFHKCINIMVSPGDHAAEAPDELTGQISVLFAFVAGWQKEQICF